MMGNSETNWDIYYTRGYKTATFSRRITSSLLVRNIEKYLETKQACTVAELGGGGSCFYDAICRSINPQAYHIVDKNVVGLAEFGKKHDNPSVVLHKADVLDLSLPIRADLVFSVGLIEHFTPLDTERAIEAHFNILKPGGLCILSYPTPTLLYRGTRRLAETLGMWIFHDERALGRAEVAKTVERFGSIIDHELIWPIFLTQEMLVSRKRVD